MKGRLCMTNIYNDNNIMDKLHNKLETHKLYICNYCVVPLHMLVSLFEYNPSCMSHTSPYHTFCSPKTLTIMHTTMINFCVLVHMKC